ncbi:MAG: DUF134 domain-containing protein [Campylobacterales bacterium]|nr:DUF134 domain-containing protein [Campylobacterales bacterium]
MGRNPHRTLSVIPTAYMYGPSDHPSTDILSLEADEFEALYLADLLDLYHEECAARLGVSRPTFAKILSSARRKTVQMLLFGKSLNIRKQPRRMVIACATDDRSTIHPHFLIARYFALVTLNEGKIETIRYCDNPIFEAMVRQAITPENDDSAKGLGAGRLIPPLLQEANLVVCTQIGEGIRRNLEGVGIGVRYSTVARVDEVANALV